MWRWASRIFSSIWGRPTSPVEAAAINLQRLGCLRCLPGGEGHFSPAAFSMSGGFHPIATLAPVRAAARLKLRAKQVPGTGTGSSLNLVRQGEGDGNMMQRIALACASLAFGIFASPLAAQQASPSQTPPPVQQPAPSLPAPPSGQPMPEATSPPAVPEAEPLPPPPPFPPMPKARPTHRWVDVGGHSRSRAHHHAVRAHHHRKAARSRAAHPSRRTIRWCRSMNHRQAMRHSACRDLKRHDHHAKVHRHHRGARQHRAAHRRHHGAGRNRT